MEGRTVILTGVDLHHGTDINISVDGLPVNMVSHAHGQGYADLHFVIPELINKVNFNKGPWFADKGNFTTAGFVEFNMLHASGSFCYRIAMVMCFEPDSLLWNLYPAGGKTSAFSREFVLKISQISCRHRV